MTKVNGLGIGQSDEWYTPPEVFAALGERFDLDPAHPAFGQTHVPTRTYYSRNGLDLIWNGFVWLNPPFGGRNAIEPWLDRFFAHGNGIALTPDRASAPWFHRAWGKADLVLFTRKVRFIKPDGTRGGSPANGCALWAIGDRARSALQRAAEQQFGILAFPLCHPHGQGIAGARLLSSSPGDVAIVGVDHVSHDAIDPVTHCDLSQHAVHQYADLNGFRPNHVESN